MFTTRTALVVAICSALVACDEATRPTNATAPEWGSPALTGGAAPSTLYDASDLAFEAAAALVESQQAATGGRATGHYELAAPIINRALEHYSFAAVATSPAPTAKGEVQLQTLFTTGQQSNVHLDVDCLVIVGNEAWFSGPARRFVLDGVEQPPGLYLVFRVQDNGEGANAPADLGSPAFSGPPMACALQPLFPMTPTANGNIDVRQR
jgi:hypothetical protein